MDSIGQQVSRSYVTLGILPTHPVSFAGFPLVAGVNRQTDSDMCNATIARYQAFVCCCLTHAVGAARGWNVLGSYGSNSTDGPSAERVLVRGWEPKKKKSRA